MIRNPLLFFALASALVACSPDASSPPEDPVRAEIDAAFKDQPSGASAERGDAAAQTPTATGTPNQPIEEQDLSDVFAGMIPWDNSREGLVTTESGLQIHVLEAGDKDGTRPDINDRVSVNYDGRLAENGSKFDSSYDRGEAAQFGVIQVIPGWTETLQLMRPGDDWLVFIPSALAYGEQGTPGGPIGPNADLVFRVTLEEVIADDTPGREIWDEYIPWNSDADEVEKTESGLEYIVRTRGDESGALVTPTDIVDMEFEIRLVEDGRRIESSYVDPAPARLPVTQLFPGWQEAIQLMRPGDDFVFQMTPAIAFGEEAAAAGRVPPDNVVMRVELMTVIIPEVSDAAAWEAHTPWDSESADVVKSENGVEYIVLETGDASGAMPTTSDTVEVYYEGRLTTGETFDSAYARGQSIEFGVTGVIPGWTATLQKMRPGDRWLVYIPADQAYGNSPRPGGLIKPGDDLIFEMQLVGVK